MELRPEVQKFAEEMEKQLRANEHKGGWENYGVEYLDRELERNLSYLQEMAYRPWVQGFSRGTKEWHILKRCANVANYAMMIADNYGNLMSGRGETDAGD